VVRTKRVALAGSFDNLRSKHLRLLEEASKWGEVRVWLWSDDAVQALAGHPPMFPEGERLYLLQAMRYVRDVSLVPGLLDPDALPAAAAGETDLWVVEEAHDTRQKQAHAKSLGIEYRVLKEADLKGFPVPPFRTPAFDSGRKRVVVTGCYDWLHSGHVRFFEEASGLGDLFVVVGHDRNIKLLKGEGHPMFSEAERRYSVQAVKYVQQTLISSGHAWMDAEPEAALIKPHIYVVNEDGDRPEKRDFCAANGIEYVVLKRLPKDGLPNRQSTDLRGFQGRNAELDPQGG